ncbi:MAG: hypothetical protein PV340_03615 [Wolbachia sp.]|nr:hypothetical protein [Wolbachia sp.]MDD9336205.1 hypothetical protein [Wolbachia sp.]
MIERRCWDAAELLLRFGAKKVADKTLEEIFASPLYYVERIRFFLRYHDEINTNDLLSKTVKNNNAFFMHDILSRNKNAVNL